MDWSAVIANRAMHEVGFYLFDFKHLSNFMGPNEPFLSELSDKHGISLANRADVVFFHPFLNTLEAIIMGAVEYSSPSAFLVETDGTDDDFG